MIQDRLRTVVFGELLNWMPLRMCSWKCICPGKQILWCSPTLLMNTFYPSKDSSKSALAFPYHR